MYISTETYSFHSPKIALDELTMERQQLQFHTQ
jgi:hypothetical protein